jgi:hypothetical protein
MKKRLQKKKHGRSYNVIAISIKLGNVCKYSLLSSVKHSAKWFYSCTPRGEREKVFTISEKRLGKVVLLLYAKR